MVRSVSAKCSRDKPRGMRCVDFLKKSLERALALVVPTIEAIVMNEPKFQPKRQAMEVA